jgi:hypothetical protein|tara:strand:- start:987 stop:1148 length:162 start_codon:yes stop_codon:yes gene_type:complete
MERKIYLFNDWLKWLNKQGIRITMEHEYFCEYYQNLKTFKNNLKEFNLWKEDI